MSIRSPHFWIAGVVLGLACWLLYPVFAGDRDRVREADLQQVTFVCSESGETFPLPAGSCPAKHPVTGKQTLWPGMYCSQCQTWKIIGPMQSLQQRKTVPLCPVHRMPLQQSR